MYQKIVKHENMVFIGKYGMAVILSGSMEKELSINDLVIVKKYDDYNINDIVVFNEEESLIVHRIVNKDGSVITTKGDANNAPDDKIDITHIKGKVINKYSNIGKYILYLSNPIYVSLFIIIFSMFNIILKKH